MYLMVLVVLIVIISQELPRRIRYGHTIKHTRTETQFFIPKNIVCVWDNNVCTRRDMYILHGECTYDTYIDETVETIITQ